MYVLPTGRCGTDHAIYTERRHEPINMMLHMDAAAKSAVNCRFKPVPIGKFPWKRRCKHHSGRCVIRKCPLEWALGCHCKIIWVDPANDVFILSEGAEGKDAARRAKFAPPFPRLYACYHDGSRDWLDGIAFTDVVTNGWPNPDRGGRGRTIEWRLDFRRVQRVQQLDEGFTEPFAPKGITRRFLVWDRKYLREKLQWEKQLNGVPPERRYGMCWT